MTGKLNKYQLADREMGCLFVGRSCVIIIFNDLDICIKYCQDRSGQASQFCTHCCDEIDHHISVSYLGSIMFQCWNFFCVGGEVRGQSDCQ